MRMCVYVCVVLFFFGVLCTYLRSTHCVLCVLWLRCDGGVWGVLVRVRACVRACVVVCGVCVRVCWCVRVCVCFVCVHVCTT